MPLYEPSIDDTEPEVSCTNPGCSNPVIFDRVNHEWPHECLACRGLGEDGVPVAVDVEEAERIERETNADVMLGGLR